MSEYDGLINEFCWDWLDFVRKGCSPFDKRFRKWDGLCLNVMWWYRAKFGRYESGPMREALCDIFFEEFGNRSYPFNRGGADFHDEDPTKNQKRLAWATQRALMHKPIPSDPLECTELHDANPNCTHDIVSAGGEGIRCSKCHGWFCF